MSGVASCCTKGCSKDVVQLSEGKKKITLDGKVWFLRNTCELGNKDMMVENIFLQIILAFGATMVAVSLNTHVYTIGLAGLALSVLIPFSIAGLLYLIIYQLKFPRFEELKKALIDIVGGKSTFEKLPEVKSEVRWDSLPLSLPEAPVFVYTTPNQGSENAYTSYQSLIAFTYNDGKETSVVLYPLAKINGFNDPKEGAPYKVNGPGFGELSKASAFLLKELVLTGKCSFDPANPKRRADIKLGKLLPA